MTDRARYYRPHLLARCFHAHLAHIDIREPDEYNAGHILGSRNIPLSQLRMRYKEIRPDQPVYMYCQNGLRTGRAGQFLKKKKYKELYQLQGGFKAWTGKIKKKA